MCTFLDEKLAVKVVGGWPLVSDMLDTTSSYASRCQQDPSQRPAHFDPRCKSQGEYKSEASLSFMQNPMKAVLNLFLKPFFSLPEVFELRKLMLRYFVPLAMLFFKFRLHLTFHCVKLFDSY